MGLAAELTEEQLGKLDDLRRIVGALGRVGVAFSGGVDSTLLLKVCADELGDEVLAITASSPSIPRREVQATRDFCETEGIRHAVVETNEFDIPGFRQNPPDRCYLCKREILGRITEAAEAEGCTVLVEGSNADDASDYRPGSRAVAEMGVRSPLREAGLTKADVRALARHLGLSVWDKPAYACLNTRFAYGDEISPERLAMVDAVEGALQELGFRQVRARISEKTVRIEVPPADVERAAASEMRAQIVAASKAAGFAYVALDLEGYRTGSMNETL